MYKLVAFFALVAVAFAAETKTDLKASNAYGLGYAGLYGGVYGGAYDGLYNRAGLGRSLVDPIVDGVYNPYGAYPYDQGIYGTHPFVRGSRGLLNNRFGYDPIYGTGLGLGHGLGLRHGLVY